MWAKPGPCCGWFAWASVPFLAGGHLGWGLSVQRFQPCWGSGQPWGTGGFGPDCVSNGRAWVDEAEKMSFATVATKTAGKRGMKLPMAQR